MTWIFYCIGIVETGLDVVLISTLHPTLLLIFPVWSCHVSDLRQTPETENICVFLRLDNEGKICKGK